jgi:hypothetical protein
VRRCQSTLLYDTVLFELEKRCEAIRAIYKRKSSEVIQRCIHTLLRSHSLVMRPLIVRRSVSGFVMTTGETIVKLK